jgi:nitrogen fixation/metabolism regulation signal transduction histidine kinase
MASRFLWAPIAAWLVLIVACAFASVAALVMAHAWIAGALLLAAAFALVFALGESMRVQQNEIARFIDAVRFADLSQSFSGRSTTGRLAKSLNSALARLRDTTAMRDADAILLRALYEHAPVAVMAVGQRGEMQMMNLAARRLFGPADTDRAALARLSPELAEAMGPTAKAGRALVRATIDGRVMRLMVASASLQSRGSDVRIVSVQNIESELGGAEFDAWRDLIRVLTHEIMNTLTPVASLSQLIRQLSDDMAAKLPDEPDAAPARAANREISDCADALSARAQTLLRFVDAYRELTRLPPPNPSDIAVAPLLDRLKTLFEGAAGPVLRVSAAPNLHLSADSGQIEQALLNLITNAREANLSAGSDAAIEIAAAEDRSGALAISVGDRGRGVSDEARERIFTPFFSTKSGGSGVGLSLVRQIALAHGGSIDHAPREGGGSTFTLRLPRR